MDCFFCRHPLVRDEGKHTQRCINPECRSNKPKLPAQPPPKLLDDMVSELLSLFSKTKGWSPERLNKALKLVQPVIKVMRDLPENESGNDALEIALALLAVIIKGAKKYIDAQQAESRDAVI